MPYVNITTPTGPVRLHYSFATPTSPNALAIDENLPSILFIHSGYIAQEVFEPQFQDASLRRKFNMIAVDMRSWGTTQGRVERNQYTPQVAADDIQRFLVELKLPSVHVFSLSIGCAVALELAVAHSQRVLSLTLCSPLPAHEPEDIAAGRHEVYYYWSHSFNHDGTTPPGDPLQRDESMLADLMHGSQQLMFNDQISRLTEAMTMTAVEYATEHWAGSPAKLEVCYTVCVDWFIHRTPITTERLSKITCPVTLIQCADDIAYPLRYAQEFKEQLQEAGLSDVSLFQITGPHFGSVVNPEATNPILLNAVLSASYGTQTPSRKTTKLPDQPEEIMVTPFTEKLALFGYDPFNDNDSDSDSDIFITSP